MLIVSGLVPALPAVALECGNTGTALFNAQDDTGDALAIACGNGASASGSSTVALGPWASSPGTYSVALGGFTVSTGGYSTAVGYETDSLGTNSVAMGAYASSAGNNSVALGNTASSAGGSSMALGPNASASNSSAVAIGSQSNVSATYGLAVGYGTSAIASYSSAFGYGASVSGPYATAVGYFAEASGNSGTALGYQAEASNFYGNALGYQATSTGTAATAMGSNAIAIANYSTAIGYRAYASVADTVILGSVPSVNGATSYASVGIGTASPLAPLHVVRNNGTAQIRVQETNATSAARTLFKLSNKGNTKFEIDETGTGSSWAFTNSGSDFRISKQGSGVVEFSVANNGNATLAGALTQNSDRNAKQAIVPIDSDEVLDKVAALPISQWQYKDETGVNHLGPMAQDFHAAFGLGATDTGISTLDSSGVALAAIQALSRRNDELAASNSDLVRENAELAQRTQLLETRLARLERLITAEPLSVVQR